MIVEVLDLTFIKSFLFTLCFIQVLNKIFEAFLCIWFWRFKHEVLCNISGVILVSIIKCSTVVENACFSSNWTTMSKKEELGGRHGKSGKLMRKTSDCLNQSFTNQEEDLIVKLHAAIGSRWSLIAQLPGRTKSEVKNIWNTKLRKKLIAMGVDPVTLT
ncbi:hypothetical protein LIER_03422 [Lithospermum erythrorhizon]|uniref:Uncharacterized protein n=1 Tax=Lithospermum erythrorhizon TaxID=34254 RepID=A0AAV3NTT9_LITER